MTKSEMRRRPSSRLLIIDPSERILLFRFVYRDGPLAGKAYWATPGGGVDEGETFEQAACRELFEETGVQRSDVGQQVAQLQYVLPLPDGEQVLADERYFLVRVSDDRLSQEQWTSLEKKMIADHRWWSIRELASTSETVFPESLVSILSASERVG